jgi:type I restriction enzyme, S subunit
MTQDLWETVVLDKVLHYRKEFIQINDLDNYKRCRVQCHVQGIVLRDVVQGIQIRTKSQKVCRANDFLVAEIDAKLGGFGIVPEDLEGAIVSSHYYLYKIDENLLDKQFFYFFIKTSYFRDQVSAQGSTNYAAIRSNDVLGYKMPLPPIAEQQRIVARIEKLAEKIEEAQELRRNATKESQALISSIHLNLAHSKRVKLSEILTLDELQEEVIFGKIFPQVGVKGFGGGLFSKEAIDSTQTTYRVFNKLYDGALVLSQVKGWEGAIAVCPTILVGKYVSPEYRTFRCIPGCAIPEYLSALVTVPWFWNQLKNLTRGMGGRRERIRPEQFLNMEIPLPSFDQQKYAISFFEKVSNMQIQRNEALRKIEGLLPTILDKAFKGEL